MNSIQRLDWQRTSLGDLFRIKHGFAFKGEFFTDSGDLIILTPGNFEPDGGVKLKGDKEKFYKGTFPSEFLLSQGDLLIVMTDLTQNAPILGSAAFVPEDDRFLHNQRLGKIVNLKQERVAERFLYYLFNSPEVRSAIKASATGATVRHTAPERIYRIEVNLPPLVVQDRIVSILSAYDDLIGNNTRRIAILEEMARALYQEWFVHFRFPGHEHVPLVDSPLRPIPGGWGADKLGEVAEIVMGQSPKSELYNEKGEGLPFHQGVTDFGAHFPIDRVFCTALNRLAESGDVLLSVRAPVGRINIATKRTVIGRGLSAIRSRRGAQSFLLFQLKQHFLEEDTMGSGTIFKAVTKADLHGLDLLIPPHKLVCRFEEFAKPAWILLQNLTARNANLRTTLDLLLPKLISGEIDVSAVSEEPIAEAAD